MASRPALVADIGGTNTRLALLDGGKIHNVTVVPTGAAASLAHAMQDFLQGREIGRAAIAVAGPVDGDTVSLTNAGWSFTADDLRAALNTGNVRIVNDFEAQALALPHLRHDELLAVGGGTVTDNRPKVVIGPGTGLGVAGLVPTDRGWIPVTTEAGHISLPAINEEEDRIIAGLRARFGHVSVERVLSGPGLVALANVLSALDGTPASLTSPDQVTAAARDGTRPHLGSGGGGRRSPRGVCGGAGPSKSPSVDCGAPTSPLRPAERIQHTHTRLRKRVRRLRSIAQACQQRGDTRLGTHLGQCVRRELCEVGARAQRVPVLAVRHKVGAERRQQSSLESLRRHL